MRVFYHNLGVCLVGLAIQGLSHAAPAQISCDGGLSQSDDGVTDSYICGGSLTISNGSLIVTDALDIEAKNNLLIEGVILQASKTLTLSATNITIDSNTSITVPGSGLSSGVLIYSIGGNNSILGTFNGVALTPPSTLQNGGVIVGRNVSLPPIVVSNPGVIVLSVPEPGTGTLMMIALSALFLIKRRSVRRP